MHKMIYSFFFVFFFCQYHETKFVSFSSNLRGFEFIIYFFVKFVIIKFFFGLLYTKLLFF